MGYTPLYLTTDPSFCSFAHIRSSGETSGPDIMALITAFPSSDFPI